MVSWLANRYREERGAIGYIILWALGVPASVLFVIFLLRGCNERPPLVTCRRRLFPSLKQDPSSRAQKTCENSTSCAGAVLAAPGPAHRRARPPRCISCASVSSR
jgi:hypothetical protein